MINPFDSAGIFLIQTLFSFYLYVILLRLLLQWFGAQYYNPISQFTIKLTDPIVKPMRRILPKLKTVDLATILLLFIVEIIKLMLLVLLKAGIAPNFAGIFIWAFADIFNLTLNIFMFAIFIVVIVSWINPMMHNPIIDAVHLLTDRILAPARQFIPPIAGFDLSPIAVLILLKLIDIILVDPTMRIGIIMTFG